MTQLTERIRRPRWSVVGSSARFDLPGGYVVVAEQSPLSSYAFNYTAIAASVKLSPGTTEPLR